MGNTDIAFISFLGAAAAVAGEVGLRIPAVKG
jgi:hypothetical protein